jgi:ribulose-5-phosphate 4-epimerase/fuculose-1-phosphate aldolase
LLPLSQHSMFSLSSLGYHDYEGVALNADEKPRLVKDLGDRRHLILRNHGLLTVGGTAAEAFLAMYYLQRSCKIQILAQSGGSELIHISDSVLAGVEAQMTEGTRGMLGDLIWPGLIRKLERVDPSYRD